MQSLGHPVVGDSLYGAPHRIVELKPIQRAAGPEDGIALDRNFLHAAHLAFTHPQTNKAIAIDAPLPEELTDFLALLRTEIAPVG